MVRRFTRQSILLRNIAFEKYLFFHCVKYDP